MDIIFGGTFFNILSLLLAVIGILFGLGAHKKIQNWFYKTHFDRLKKANQEHEEFTQYTSFTLSRALEWLKLPENSHMISQY